MLNPPLKMQNLARIFNFYVRVIFMWTPNIVSQVSRFSTARFRCAIAGPGSKKVRIEVNLNFFLRFCNMILTIVTEEYYFDVFPVNV